MRPYSWIKVKKSGDPYDREVRPSFRTCIGLVNCEWYDWGKLICYADRGEWELHTDNAPPPGSSFWAEDAYKRSSLYMALKKLKNVAEVQPGGQAGTVADAPLYPTLWEHLSLTAYPDGEKRATSFLMIFAGEAAWRGCLKDVDNARLCWKTGGTLEELLSALEDAAMKDDPADWRKEMTQQKRSNRKSS